MSGITSSNPTFAVSPTSMSIAPEDSAVITITFTPNDMGVYDDSLAIFSNDPHNPMMEVHLSGIGNSIVTTYPPQNAVHVPLDTVISVTFFVDMDPTTINANTFVVHGIYTGKLNGSYRYDAGTYTATFIPDQNFKAGEQIRVTLTSWIQTADGAVRPLPTSWDLTAEVLDGSSIMSKHMEYDTGPWTRALAIADFDGDGVPDLAVANMVGGGVSVLMGNGDGTVGNSTYYGTGANPSGVTGTDLDGDGDVDLVVTNLLSYNVSILKNKVHRRNEYLVEKDVDIT